MDIRQLTYFITVARTGNITKAANELYITQPSLSKQISNLERELGKKLLFRSKRGITLTEDGILLRKRAEEIVGLMDKTKAEIKSTPEQVGGQIVIGGGPSNFVISVAAKFRKHYPGVNFEFLFGDANDINERLDHGSVDFALLLAPINSKKYNYLVIPETLSWGVIMKKKNPLSAHKVIRRQDLSKLPIIIHQRHELQKMIEKWYGQDISKLNIAGTYNIINGDPDIFIKHNLGNILTANTFIDLKEHNDLCFRPLKPAINSQFVLIW